MFYYLHNCQFIFMGCILVMQEIKCIYFIHSRSIFITTCQLFVSLAMYIEHILMIWFWYLCDIWHMWSWHRTDCLCVITLMILVRSRLWADYNKVHTHMAPENETSQTLLFLPWCWCVSLQSLRNSTLHLGVSTPSKSCCCFRISSNIRVLFLQNIPEGWK